MVSLDLRVGCRFELEIGAPSPLALLVEPPAATADSGWTLPAGVELPDPERDSHGNRFRRLLLPAGSVGVEYSAVAAAPAALDPVPGDAPQERVEALPAEVLQYLLPSRYCESDRLLDLAWAEFETVPPGAPRVQAVCDWVHGHLSFRYGSTDVHASACTVLEGKEGVCRDFTHLAVALCRALTIPTRYAFGYLPDIEVAPTDDPMDFAAWMEVYLGGTWWTYDPRNNARRIGRTVIGRGRDAADVAMITSWGPVELRSMTVTAEPVR